MDRQAVAEFQNQFFNPNDLKSFFSKYVPTEKNVSVYKWVGTSPSGGGSGVEAALDVEYIMGVAPGILTEFWGFIPSIDYYVHSILAILNDHDNNPYISVQYG